jgi:non-canonical purine NTP pyrophosphatase (RdgB/HAM1 family)
MHLSFVTTNSRKLQEIQAVLPGVNQLKHELIEMQSLDPQEIIAAKLKQAQLLIIEPFIVDDTSLYLQAIPGLPGPLIKWFIKALGPLGVYEMAYKLGNLEAEARTLLGLSYNNTVHFFEGTLKGTLVAPRGAYSYGWDSIFQPLGYTKTFAEMDFQEKAAMSMRYQALIKLRNYLSIIAPDLC